MKKPPSTNTAHQPFENRASAANRQQLKAVVEKEVSVSPPSHSNNKVPSELDDLIMGLLWKNPEERPQATATNALAFLDEKWPEESKEMPHKITSTLTGG